MNRCSSTSGYFLCSDRIPSDELTADLQYDDPYYDEQDPETRQIFHLFDDLYDSPLFVIQLTYPRSFVRHGIRVIRLSFGFMLIFSMAVVALICFILGGMFIRPLQEVVDKYSHGDFPGRLRTSPGYAAKR